MQKSIETIWKEGFINSDELTAPKITNFDSKKSKHITDKFKRMFKINLIAIALFAFVVLALGFIKGIPILGISSFIILIGMVIANKILMNGLQNIVYHLNSYEYLIAFNKWLQEQLAINRKMAQLYCPLFFLAFVFGFWFMDAEGLPLGERLVGEVLYGFPNIYLINGIPLIAIITVVAITSLLAIFGGRIYNLDVKIVYGRLFKKIEGLITDLEELRK